MEFLKAGLLMFILLTVSACGGGGSVSVQSGFSAKVLNGAEADQSELPQYVKVKTEASDGAYSGCTGTVIGAAAVLTAAHCVFSGHNLVVQTGDDNGPLFYPVKIFIGQSYDGVSSRHDIAVIVTDRVIERPALPLLGSTRPVPGEEIMVVGFGVEDGEDGEYGTLRHGNMKLREVTPEQLVVVYDGEGSNVCFGDSGGPAIYFVTDASGNSAGPAVAGVVSGGTDPACGEGDTTYFTSVEPFISNILEIVPDASVR